ncbi:hypothetical protein BD324DRAFT_635405 [Kockovaella imperatae]|uniref:Zn(2)-C6 fungal-type domain-containing protein n=1 Tax=Kockovaella imperatae TaxID=4999 RepID=A0A1Y1UBK1_9TREE|nr:hypothetical protein BD324DRAFT_635405 [Kockovaella imperatae]ORX34866.1 hypothetical protein BD324DRAFT_635405 [Kockovaella imperatae]
MQAQASRPIRSRRARRACDACHRTNSKCTAIHGSETCRTCADFGEPCTYNRLAKRRGPKIDPMTGKRPSSNQDVDWKYAPIADHSLVENLADEYLRIVYPIFPLFHWPSFISKVHRRLYENDRAFFATVMAMCAVVAGRIENRSSQSVLSLLTPTTSSEAFKAAAISAIPVDLTLARDFDYKRTKSLLAILCVQLADIKHLHIHLGDYMTLSLASGFYDEQRWPNLPPPEREEWRRLFWSTYTLEIFTAISWDGIVRHRQSQTNVRYPVEVVNDDAISPSGCLPASGVSTFIRGWNITTDLYRILEHLVDRMRCTQLRPSPSGVARTDTVIALFTAPGPSVKEIRQLVDATCGQLGPEFQQAHAMTGDLDMDRYGFQVANLTLTAQTAYMILATADGSSIEEQCAVIQELLGALSLIPTAYIASISTPMLHHVASIGHLLGNVIQSPLTPWAFSQVRDALLGLANLITGLEAAIGVALGISSKLRALVHKIDERMGMMAHNGVHRSHSWNASTQERSHESGQDNSSSDPTLLFATPEQQDQLRMELREDWPFNLEHITQNEDLSIFGTRQPLFDWAS